MTDLALPFEEPVLIFALVLLIILLAPLLFSRIRVPGIVGLILAGMLVGPYGLNLLLRDASIVLFGTVGLLYIMFLAGLEIDLNDFRKNRNRSLVFGALTFFIPQSVGMLAGRYLLGFGWPATILLASMFASHTLLTYPIASRMGLAKNEAVTVTVGGTIITDTAALLVLAVIAGSVQGELNGAFWLRLVVAFTIFVFIVLWIMPRIGVWFFKTGQGDGSSQYIFVLALVFAAAFLAEVAGVEAIIGAFLAGLALNRLVPHTSPLMNRIEFVGSTLFVPFFLISVGMLVDVRVLFQGTEALLVAGTMIGVACGCKWLAAFFTQKIFGYSAEERGLIFGLSNSQAAATLAAVLVGFNLGLLNEAVLNGTVLMILVTCLISSFATEASSRKLAVVESKGPLEVSQEQNRILVPIANPVTIEQLMDLAIMIKNPQSREPIFPLVVVQDDEDVQQRVAASYQMLERAIKHVAATETAVQVVSRVDLNVASGIVRAIKELMITEVVIGWNAQMSTQQRVFGSVLDHLLHTSRQMILVSRLVHPLNVAQKIVIVVPPHAELETGFRRWLRTLTSLSKQAGSPLHFFAAQATLNAIEPIIEATKPAVEAASRLFEDWEDFLVLSREVTTADLLVIISARHGSVSYNKYLDGIPRKLAQYFDTTSFVIVFPEQNAISPATGDRPRGRNTSYIAPKGPA
jgi:Kef-type K+ transport system membrane component KefB